MPISNSGLFHLIFLIAVQILIVFCFSSLFVAQYEEYRPHLIQHLVDRKISHWDTVIRQLTSQVQISHHIFPTSHSY